jgi:hypothetical protein
MLSIMVLYEEAQLHMWFVLVQQRSCLDLD